MLMNSILDMLTLRGLSSGENRGWVHFIELFRTVFEVTQKRLEKKPLPVFGCLSYASSYALCVLSTANNII